MSRRGGMCSDPFLGKPRLDRLDLRSCLPADEPPECLLFLETISDAVSNYLYFGLGRNGTTGYEFFCSYRYFYVVRSDDPLTWESAHIQMCYETEEGERIRQERELTEEEMKMGCFDVHYDRSGLSRRWRIERFLRSLKTMRLNIVLENQERIQDYLRQLRERDFDRLLEGSQTRLPLLSADMISTLVEPRNGAAVAELLFVPLSEFHKPRRSVVAVPFIQSSET